MIQNSPFLLQKIFGNFSIGRSIVLTLVLTYFQLFAKKHDSYSFLLLIPFQVYVLFSLIAAMKLFAGINAVSLISVFLLSNTTFLNVFHLNLFA
jgi:hypothetical protein